jgi:hypothetical protein
LQDYFRIVRGGLQVSHGLRGYFPYSAPALNDGIPYFRHIELSFPVSGEPICHNHLLFRYIQLAVLFIIGCFSRFIAYFYPKMVRSLAKTTCSCIKVNRFSSKTACS